MKIKSIILFLLVTLSQLSYGQEIPKPMSPARLVNDFAEVLDSRQREALEQTLRTYNDTTSTQIYVVIVNSLGRLSPNDFATRLGHEWGVGQNGKDNGAVILMKPRIGNERGQVYISVGYGLEHVLNDARIGRIIDVHMLDHLARGNYYEAANEAALTMIEMLAGEYQADDIDDIFPLGTIIFIILFFAIFIGIAYKKANDDDQHGNQNRRSRNSRGGFFPPMGGGGGRGFGGGGGGSFGGGGAGRSF